MKNINIWTARRDLLIAFLIPVVSGLIAALMDQAKLQTLGAIVFAASSIPAFRFLYRSLTFKCPSCGNQWQFGMRKKCRRCEVDYGDRVK